MIQRVQSIYLLLATLAGLMTFFLSYAHFDADGAKVAEYAMFGVFNVQSEMLEMTGPYSFPVWIFGALAVIVPFLTIFLYKNRPMQLRLAHLASLMNLGYVVYLFFAVDAINEQVFDNSLRVLHQAGFYMPVIAIVFCFLGVRGIKRDEALIKSLDRIR